MAEIEYTKFRWFFTSSGLLVIGGKSAAQNEEIMKIAKMDDVMLHTSDPGSPFCVVKDNIEETGKDVQEAAVFCASLSKAWKSKKKSAEVDIFRKDQVYKTKSMAKGTFGVKGDVERIKVELKLYLDFQEGRLRSVPFETDIALLTPGLLSKEKAADAISKRLEVPIEEVMSALPSEGISIKWL